MLALVLEEFSQQSSLCGHSASAHPGASSAGEVGVCRDQALEAEGVVDSSQGSVGILGLEEGAERSWVLGLGGGGIPMGTI